MEICQNVEILKVLYFFFTLIDIVKIIIPIGLIVIGIIDFSKAVVISDEKVQKNTVSLFLKRLMYAILVFAVPWIVKVLMVTLGDALGKEGTLNFTDCIQNANERCIEALDNNRTSCACDTQNRYVLNFDFNGGTCWNYPEQNKAEGFVFQDREITIPENIKPTRDGWDFMGWRLIGEKTGEYKPGSNYTPNNKLPENKDFCYKEANFIAIWGKGIIFDSNFSNRGEDEYFYDVEGLGAFIYYENEPKKLPEIKYNRVGYKFVGWSKTPNDTTADCYPGELCTLDGENETTLYGIWELIS